MTGHTHDLVDAFFALVSKILHGKDVLNLSDMQRILKQGLSKPPTWFPFQDMYDFKKSRPPELTANFIQGIESPHHVYLEFDRRGNIVMASKRWLTDAQWTEEAGYE